MRKEIQKNMKKRDVKLFEDSLRSIAADAVSISEAE